MGCDIHLFVERKHKGKWVMSHEVRGPGAERNYKRFGADAFHETMDKAAAAIKEQQS